MPDLREVFEMTTKQMGEPDMDSWREQERRQRNASRNKRLGAIAVVAAIAVAAIALIVGTRGGQDTTTPADQPTATPTAKEVATGFVEAFGAFDADGAISYLADDADILPLMTSVGIHDAEGTLAEFQLLISLWQAGGYKQTLDSCEAMESPASATEVRCTFDFHNLGSDEIGLGPYSGSYFDLTVRDGEIVRASQYWNVTEFSPQVWDPFAAWVTTNYPDDVDVMYQGGMDGSRLTEESIRLWERHTREYVEEVKQGTA